MIHAEILSAAVKYCSAFNAAKPFKHLVLDDFFEAETASNLLEEFPTFEDRYALNEFGDVGGKAVITKIERIGPYYKKIYQYLNSKEFLNSISDLTGIQNLIADPAMYGGGTHENVEGQELDAHVDYNYINGGKLHRRLNLIVYFNEEWDENWGGSIELHSDPRKPEENEITSVLPLYNRALIFETNEYSWHGFPKIKLPEGKKHLSRKSLAIYLYTKDRPEDEIAESHSTFYIQRPLPEHIKEGFTLDAESVHTIKELLTRRDDMIEYYQLETLRTQSEKTLLRLLYQAFPLPVSFKQKVKSFIFTCFGFMFRNQAAYQSWLKQKNLEK